MTLSLKHVQPLGIYSFWQAESSCYELETKMYLNSDQYPWRTSWIRITYLEICLSRYLSVYSRQCLFTTSLGNRDKLATFFLVDIGIIRHKSRQQLYTFRLKISEEKWYFFRHWQRCFGAILLLEHIKFIILYLVLSKHM